MTLRRRFRSNMGGLVLSVAGARCLFLAACLLAAGACGKEESAPVRLKIGAILMQQDQFFCLNELGMKAAAEDHQVDLRVQNATGALAAKGTVLASPDFLPGSTFAEKELDVAVQKDRTFAVSVPKHSATRIQLSYG